MTFKPAAYLRFEFETSGDTCRASASWATRLLVVLIVFNDMIRYDWMSFKIKFIFIFLLKYDLIFNILLFYYINVSLYLLSINILKYYKNKIKK